MNSWSPLADGIVDSSIWEEEDHVFRVFIGMLSIKGPDHVVRMDSYKLSRRLHMEHPVVLDALRVLSSPDTKRLGQPHEGRRLQAVEGGWLFLNGEAYREQVRLIMKRARDARAQANYRARKAGKPVPYPIRKRAAPEEVAEAHEEVKRTTINSSEAEAENLVAMRRLDELQGSVE